MATDGLVQPERVRNRWGFESFTSEDAARAHCRRFPASKPGRWHIWRLPDGTYDYTTTETARQVYGLCAEFIGYVDGTTDA